MTALVRTKTLEAHPARFHDEPRRTLHEESAMQQREDTRKSDLVHSTEPQLRPGMDPDKLPDHVSIIGWKIHVYTTLPSLGLVPDFHEEYGNSPVRDRKSRIERIRELCEQGRDFSVTPILRNTPRR